MPLAWSVAFVEVQGVGIPHYFLTHFILGYMRWKIYDFARHLNGVGIYLKQVREHDNCVT